jgi:hypothetical protein
MSARLSTLDSSFLEVETPSAHMHAGWAPLFRPTPEEGADLVLRDARDDQVERARRGHQSRGSG